jgi:hypothetical protein
MATVFELDGERKQLKQKLAVLIKECDDLPVDSIERLAISVTIATLQIELSNLRRQIINSRKNYFG